MLGRLKHSKSTRDTVFEQCVTVGKWKPYVEYYQAIARAHGRVVCYERLRNDADVVEQKLRQSLEALDCDNLTGEVVVQMMRLLADRDRLGDSGVFSSEVNGYLILPRPAFPIYLCCTNNTTEAERKQRDEHVVTDVPHVVQTIRTHALRQKLRKVAREQKRLQRELECVTATSHGHARQLRDQAIYLVLLLALVVMRFVWVLCSP